MLSYDSVRSEPSIELQSCLFEYAELKQYQDLPKRTYGISDPCHSGPRHFGPSFKSFRPKFLRHFFGKHVNPEN